MSSESATLVGIAVSSFGVGIATSALPGPTMAYMISRALEGGFGPALLVLVGVLAVDACILAAGIVGFAGILGTPLFTGITAFVGGVFLTWTGVRVLRGTVSDSLSNIAMQTRSAISTKNKPIHPLLGGILATVGNPLYWIWWGSVGLGYINWTMGIGKAALIAFIVGLMGGLILFHVFLAYVFGKGRTFISDKLYRGVVLVSGGVLTAFGFYFVYLGFENLSLL